MTPSASNATLPDARTNLHAYPQINVKDYGAIGGTATLTSCASSTSPNQVTCSGSALVDADVNKAFLCHGTGASGIAQQGVISSLAGQIVTPSFTVATAASGLKCSYGPDDTAAERAAITAGVAAQGIVYHPPSVYWLASQTTAMPTFNNVVMKGDGAAGVVAASGYYGGAQLWISNTSTVAFTLGRNWTWDGLTTLYPAQDGGLAQVFTGNTTSASAVVTAIPSTTGFAVGDIVEGTGIPDGNSIATVDSATQITLRFATTATNTGISLTRSAPTVYPALFGVTSGVTAQQGSIRNSAFLNPYVLLKVDDTGDGSGLAFVSISNSRGYCIFACAWFTEGAASTNEIGDGTFWSVGTYGDLNTGNQYLPKWTAVNGAWLLVDVGAATKTTIDGMVIAPGVIHGYRWGARVLSGTLSASFRPHYLEAQTALSIEGTAIFQGTFSVPGWMESSTPYGSGKETASAISCASSGGSLLSVTNTYFKNAKGHILDDTTSGCFDYLNVTGNVFHAWGQSTTSGTYDAMRLGVGAAAHDFNIVGNELRAVTSGSNVMEGVRLSHAAGQANVSGNQCVAVDYCVVDAGSDTGNIFVSGNTSRSTGTASLRQTGTHAILEGVNAWDKPPQPVRTSGWGTGNALATNSTDQVGKITIGSSPSSPATLTFGLAKPAAPVCVFIDETSGLLLPAATTTAAATVTGVTTASDVVSYRCQSF